MASFRCAMRISDLLLESTVEKLLLSLDENNLRALSEKLGNDAPSPEEPSHRLAYSIWYTLYFHTKETADLNHAIRIAEVTLVLLAAGSDKETTSEQALTESNLSCMLDSKFDYGGQAMDLDQAICRAESALTIASPSDAHVSKFREHLNKLKSKKDTLSETFSSLDSENKWQMPSYIFGSKLLCMGYLRDSYIASGEIHAAIQFARMAVAETPQRHPERCDNLHKLGDLLFGSAIYKKIFEYVQESIDCFQEAARISVGTSDHAICLLQLSETWALKYSWEKDISYVENSVSAARQALQCIPEGHEQRAKYLCCLGTKLRGRYERTSSPEDVEEAYRTLNEAFSLDILEKGVRLNCGTQLATVCVRKYEITKDITFINKGIETCESLVNEDKSSSEAGECMHVLAQLHRMKVDVTGTHSKSETDKAVEFARKAVDALAEGHQGRPNREANLARLLARRAKLFHSIEDGVEAQEIAWEVLISTTDTDTTRAGILDILIEFESARYRQENEVVCLELLLEFAQNALDEASPNNRNYSSHINNVAYLRTLSGEVSKDPNEIESGINLLESFIRNGQDDGHRGKQLDNLGFLLEKKYEMTRDRSDSKRAIEALIECGETPAIDAWTKVDVAYRAAKLYIKDLTWDAASSLLEDAVKLLPKVSPRHIQHKDKTYNLARFGGMVSLAMSAALQAGRSGKRALEIIEHGRGVILGMLYDARSDIARLRKKRPDLAKAFVELRDKLDSPVSSDPEAPETHGSLNPFLAREALQTEFDKVVKEIQDDPDFRRFLEPTTAEELMAASESGTIIVVSASDSHSHALVVTPNEVVPISLRGFRLSQIQYWAGKLKAKDVTRGQMYGMLRWLWRFLVAPILNSPIVIKASAGEVKPHICWVPVGALCALPIHAAGNYSKAGPLEESALRRAISSYSPSIKALLYIQHSRREMDVGCRTDRVLLVSMEKTLDCRDLPYARQEVDLLNENLPSEATLIKNMPLKKDVKEALPGSSIFHFAGHGISHPLDPLKSSLLLKDWKDDALTVEDLMTLNLDESPPFLAYLSACSTAVIKDPKLIDEGIHLMSAFQLVGFHHVIGSLWALSDEHCVAVAADVYDEIMKSNMSDDSVPCGLHNAVTRLSEGKFLSNRHVELREVDEDEDDLASWDLSVGDPRIWAAYIHMGLRNVPEPRAPIDEAQVSQT
ncbi:uncharacterized protein LY89DRAFT_53945 [Mollisia scopiformis]|uniref:CHAT domain-containing protein n=1 Tax=Mollisia scopiformis TaxID=149040 RepID=A0A194XBB8_MOLSC|nr:uncharacterized protein LY89DRAFT_53945 [Mollisia scopiformis]KUJ17458.1 hypothetical protein LY89DRAFT_53945 [Mollisia scopiformis]